jgi:hypothetical protein
LEAFDVIVIVIGAASLAALVLFTDCTNTPQIVGKLLVVPLLWGLSLQGTGPVFRMIAKGSGEPGAFRFWTIALDFLAADRPAADYARSVCGRPRAALPYGRAKAWTTVASICLKLDISTYL